MKVSVNIRIRNPEWYWTKEELKKSKQKGEMSREEWEMLFGDKIDKHSSTLDFEYAFDVLSHHDNRNTNFPCVIYSKDSESGQLIPHDVVFYNMTVVEFIGENTKSFVAISNELIHQYLGVKQKNGRFYRYFYLKENMDSISFSNYLWITIDQFNNLPFEPYAANIDENIIIRSIGMLR